MEFAGNFSWILFMTMPLSPFNIRAQSVEAQHDGKYIFGMPLGSGCSKVCVYIDGNKKGCYLEPHSPRPLVLEPQSYRKAVKNIICAELTSRLHLREA